MMNEADARTATRRLESVRCWPVGVALTSVRVTRRLEPMAMMTRLCSCSGCGDAQSRAHVDLPAEQVGRRVCEDSCARADDEAAPRVMVTRRRGATSPGDILVGQLSRREPAGQLCAHRLDRHPAKHLAVGPTSLPGA